MVLTQCTVYSSSRTPDEWVRPLSSLFLCLFFALFFVLFFGWVRGVNYCRCSYSSIFHSIPKIYLFLAFQVTKRVAYLFFGCFS